MALLDLCTRQEHTKVSVWSIIMLMFVTPLSLYHRCCRLRGSETARVHGQFTEILETLLASVAKDGRARLMCTKAR